MGALEFPLQELWHNITPHLSTPILQSTYKTSMCWYPMVLESGHVGKCFPTCFTPISLPQCQPNLWELGMISPIYSLIPQLCPG